MNYAAQSRRPSAGALFGSLAIPAGFGALLITGLAVTYVAPVPNPNPIGVLVQPKPIDPPIEESKEPEAPKPATAQKAPNPTLPDIPTVFNPGPAIETDPFPDFGEIVLNLPPMPSPGEIVGPQGPLPRPVDDTVPATPRGNPADWISTSDYRTVWINRGFAGTARFTLEIDASGRVTDCAITGSTGYEALDGATCRLLKRRARFAPARNGAGDKVAGTYSSAVTWQIP